MLTKMQAVVASNSDKQISEHPNSNQRDIEFIST